MEARETRLVEAQSSCARCPAHRALALHSSCAPRSELQFCDTLANDLTVPHPRPANRFPHPDLGGSRPIRQGDRSRSASRGPSPAPTPEDDHCRQDHILHRRDASSEHRKPEIEPQRGEDDEHRIHIGGGALQAYTGSTWREPSRMRMLGTLVSTNAFKNRSGRGRVLPCSSRRPTI